MLKLNYFLRLVNLMVTMFIRYYLSIANIKPLYNLKKSKTQNYYNIISKNFFIKSYFYESNNYYKITIIYDNKKTHVGDMIMTSENEEYYKERYQEVKDKVEYKDF